MDFKTILVIRLDEIGDMVTTLPVFEALKHQFPQTKLTLWCQKSTFGLVQNNPFIDLIVCDKKDLRQPIFDLIIDLRGHWQGIQFALKHPPKYRLDRGTIRLKDKWHKRPHLHEVLINFEILKPILNQIPRQPTLKLYPSKRNEQVADLFLQRLGISHFAIFHTGARKLLRRWSIKSFVEVAEFLHQNQGLDIVFVGTSDEQFDIKNIQDKISFPTFSFAGEGTLMDFAALASKAALMIGNESGPMHIAAAANIPVLGLFGPGEPHIFSPVGQKATYIHHKLECNPCDQIHCKYPKNPCMNRITVDEVLQKIKDLGL